MLCTGTNGTVNPINVEAAIYKKIMVKPFELSEPDVVIDREISLKEFGVDGRIRFTPGHTKGSISILFGNYEAIVGDVMMGGIMSGNLFGSRPTYHYFFDDFDAIKSSIQKIIEMKPWKVHVGHGGPLLMEDVIRRFEIETAKEK